jgi:hypothetical protein
MKWQPEIISRLFLDNADYNGILFYYEDIAAEHMALEAEKKAIKAKAKK